MENLHDVSSLGAISNDSATKVITVQLIPQCLPRSSECTLRNARRPNRLSLIDSVYWRPIEKRVFVVVVVVVMQSDTLCVSSRMRVIFNSQPRVSRAERESIGYVTRTM